VDTIRRFAAVLATIVLDADLLDLDPAFSSIAPESRSELLLFV
jgi:hypothetical protein